MNNSEKINLINDLCSSYKVKEDVFSSTKCLTYIDEFEQKLGGTKRATSLVSLTALMSHYINNIERNWLTDIRIKYGFKMGEPIHFTNVRKIAQEVTFTNKHGDKEVSLGWNDDYISYRGDSLIDYDNKTFKPNVKSKNQKEFVEEYKVWSLFRKEDDLGFGSLDVEKLKSFYEDIFSVIKNANFDILCTTILYDTAAPHRKRFISDQVKSPYTIAFGEHLDLLCFYLKNGFYTDEEFKTTAKKPSHSFSTKLRWDGDDGFNPRSDYRLLFNKVISLGTTHYQSETVRKCLDEIRFVNKSEIGYYDDIANQTIVSHIGCDIADFITYFVGKHAIKDEILKAYSNEGLSPDDCEKKFNDSITFKIGDRVFSPYEEILKDKILKTDLYTSIQIFNECHYNLW